jgi:hypothetical protein
MSQDRALSLTEERAELIAALKELDEAASSGRQHPNAYRAGFYRQQIAELNDLIGDVN